jgi:hypothetical protein
VGKFLGINLPKPAAPAAEVAAPAGEAPAAEPVKTEPELTVEQREKIARMQGDLRWLVMEGYVTEFIDGRLFAPPPMVEARKKEVEAEEHDPENFPEIPASNPPFAAKAETPAEPVVPAAPVEAAAPVEPAPAAPAVPETPVATGTTETAPAEPEATDKSAQA